ncbi:MAG: patatin-like phospholipase family protein [Hyphomicrobiales bacterium]
MQNSRKISRAIRAFISPVLQRVAGTDATQAPGRVPGTPAKAARTKRLRLSLALQGGGSLGAFTWGVLDRLLEDKDIALDAVSGASAGAINAVLLAAGLRQGGVEGAREVLARFWERASKVAPRHPGGRASSAFDLSTRIMSPYQFNPLDFNPLRSLLGEVDFEALRNDPPLRLLIGATRVSDGRLRVFREHEITQDVVLASACLPLLHHAVTIEGEAYWDGGYAANPPLMPLVTASRAADIVVVQIIPTAGEELPRTSPEIIRRLNQMTFNNSLLHDLDTLSSMMELAKEQDGEGRLSRKLRRLRLHRVSAEDAVPDLSELSAFNLDWDLLARLRESGRAAAEAWLDERQSGEQSEAAGEPIGSRRRLHELTGP